MGSAAGKLFRGGGSKIEFMESTKMPTAKDMDMRRRNSLMFFMRDWQELATFEEQEASMLQVRSLYKTVVCGRIHVSIIRCKNEERDSFDWLHRGAHPTKVLWRQLRC